MEIQIIKGNKINEGKIIQEDRNNHKKEKIKKIAITIRRKRKITRQIK